MRVISSLEHEIECYNMPQSSSFVLPSCFAESREVSSRLAAARHSAGEEVEAALCRATEGYVPHEHLAAEQVRSAALERRAASLAQQCDGLQAQLAKEKAQACTGQHDLGLALWVVGTHIGRCWIVWAEGGAVLKVSRQGQTALSADQAYVGVLGVFRSAWCCIGSASHMSAEG
jgi:hypothetical protein